MKVLQSPVGRLTTLVLAFMLAFMPVFPGKALAQGTNAKVRAAYAKVVKRLGRKARGHGANYRYVDVYGSGVKELLCVTKDESGSGRTLRIYTYAGGKVKRLLTCGLYGDNWYKFYKRTKSFVLYRSGHGGETYQYFTFKNGKYREVAAKGRTGVKGGGAYNGAWGYWVAGSRRVSKKAFDKHVARIAKGKAKKVSSSYMWKWMEC